MTTAIFVTGTDTDVGKTVFCAGLVRLLDAVYWKPVQAGLTGETDTQVVQRLANLPADRVLPEAWRLNTPASPHLAAERDGVAIDPAALCVPTATRPVIIEGAGGLMVPLTRQVLFIDRAAQWRIPTVLCARTRLGTINHTLLSIEALRTRCVPLLGVAFIGEPQPDSEAIISSVGNVAVLGRLPILDPLNSQSLAAAFSAAFRADSFASAPTP
jgi:dethiobiotin synthetase